MVQVREPDINKDFEVQRRVLNSFKGGKATVQTFENGTKLYRIGGKKGSFWSLEYPPATEYQWRVDYAI